MQETGGGSLVRNLSHEGEPLKGPGRDEGLWEEDGGHGLEKMTMSTGLEGLIHSARTCGCLRCASHCASCHNRRF